MSLDVYLITPGQTRPEVQGRIWVRQDGRMISISREEWDARHPDREPCTFRTEGETDEVWHGNITHNLAPMARLAGVDAYLWRPEENGMRKAGQIIRHLREGLAWLRSSPEHFRKYNPENGWGRYESLLSFVEEYLAACEAHPDAEITVSV